MGAIIPAAADIAADKADPQVDVGVADAAFNVSVVERKTLARLAKVVLCVATYRAAATLPLLETGAVEDMLAYDGEETCGFVHSLQANGACG
jgi:hypothetical protein